MQGISLTPLMPTKKQLFYVMSHLNRITEMSQNLQAQLWQVRRMPRLGHPPGQGQRFGLTFAEVNAKHYENFVPILMIHKLISMNALCALDLLALYESRLRSALTICFAPRAVLRDRRPRCHRRRRGVCGINAERQERAKCFWC